MSVWQCQGKVGSRNEDAEAYHELQRAFLGMGFDPTEINVIYSRERV